MSKSLRIIADVASLQGDHRERGISRYAECLLREILRDRSVELLCRIHPDMNGLSVGSPLERTVRSDSQIVGELAQAPTIPSVYLLTSPFEALPSSTSLLPRWINDLELPMVSIVYDLIPKLFPEIYLPTAEAQRWYETRLALLAASDLLLAISDATRRDVLNNQESARNRIVTIGSGVDMDFFCPESSGPESVYSNLILCVAGYEPRKNVPRLLEAWATLSPELRRTHELKIVCALPDQGRREWEMLALDLGLGEKEVHFTGRVRDEELREFYRTAKLVVAPYLYEGFGLPVAEAACCGAPVICSSTSSLPEILNNPAGEFDPSSVVSIAQAIEAALVNEDHRSELRRVSLREGKRHDWRSVATKSIMGMKAVARTPTSDAQSRRRLLLVTPTAPSLSGVAIYSSNVQHAFSDNLEVTVAQDHSPSERPVQSETLRLLQARCLTRRFSDFDFGETLIALGNSDYHMSSLDIALSQSVNLWLHDLVLTGLVTSRVRQFPDVGVRVDWINGLLAAGKNNDRRLVVDRNNYLDDAYYREQGVRFIEPLLKLAKKVVVNSEYARKIVLSTELIEPSRVKTVPHAYRLPPRQFPRSETPMVVSMGWVGPLKKPTLIIEAMQFVDPKAILVFAGPIESWYEQHLRQVSESAGVSDRVVFTGALDEVDYWKWCAKPWIGVQLRSGSNAESSGAVADLMASGTPLITDLPTANEIDPTAIVKIEQGCSPSSLGVEIDHLLSNSDRRRELSSKASAVAENWTYRSVAESIESFLF